MPPFTPYTYQVGNDGLYNPAVQATQAGLGDTRPRWTSGPQPVVHPLSEQLYGATKFGLGIGAIGLLGNYQFSSTKRGWDYMLHGIRAVEEYSPGRVFRTFQMSHMLSVLESPSLQKRYFSPEMLSAMRAGGVDSAGYKWLEHLSRVTGRNMTAGDIISQGFRYEGGQLLVGETGRDVLLRRAGVVRAPSGTGTRFQEGYARSLARGPLFDPKAGTDPILRESRKAAQIFSQRVPFLDSSGVRQAEPFMFVGGQSRFQAARRFASGYGTALAERINQLARAPFELPVISDIMNRLPIINRLRLGVIPSSGLKTIGKVTAKLGILGTAGMLSYRQLDYAARESEMLDNTLLAEGIGPAVGNIWTRSQMALSGMADWIGLHTYRERQEEIAPGSTELSKLTAFPILGAFGGLLGGYAARLGKQFRYRRLGLSLTQASLATGAEDAFFRQAVYGKQVPEIISGGLDKRTIELIQESTDKKVAGLSGRFIQRIAQTQRKRTAAGALLRGFGQFTPSRLGWVGGALLGAAAVAPLLPGALVPSTRPEELEKIYSGEQKVAVRKGRWWEFGRCCTYMSHICVDHGKYKFAKDVTLEDNLMSPSGEKQAIVAIHQRRHRGPVYYITTSLDRNTPTGLTANHIVPVMKERNSHGYHILKDERIVEEVEARKIEVGDFVQVPVPQLNLLEISNCDLELEDFVKVGKFLLTKDKILPAQTNWYTKKLQQSSGKGLPRNIKFTHRLGRLFGYFLAEGNLSFKNDIPSMIETVHAVGEKWIVDDILYIVESLFGIAPTVRYKEAKKDTDEGCWIVRICNSLLARIFFELFYRSNRSTEKEIPWWFLDTSRWFLDAVILGLWRGDGHQDGQRHYVSSCRRQFIDFIQVALLSKGIVPTIPKVERCQYVKKDNKISLKYRIGWVPDSEGQPGQGYQWKSHKLYVRVINVRYENYNNTVYDFEVDHPDHLYQAGTFLVHNSPYEGTRIDRFREHWYPRMLHRAKEKAIWGEDAPNPFERFWIENFTYELEQKHYKDRPYPMTGTAFEDIPFVGPLLAATVGQLVKPAAIMHPEAWIKATGADGGDQRFKSPHLKYGQSVLPGEAEVGEPISPYGVKGVVGEQVYRMTEMVGLPGFTMTQIKEAITGSQDTFDQEMQLETARRMYGAERDLWDLELGGGLGTTELLRRLYPHRRRQIELYNPIRNTMPEWLPGPAERSPDFLHGDPYTKVPEGEMRLPGAGYATLHPELKGIAPEDYPAFHRFSILADVAPYTDKYKESLIQVRQAIKEKELSQEQIAQYKETLKQVSARKVRREFSPYKYRDRKMTEWETALATKNEAVVEGSSEPSWFESTVGKYWEELAHGAETPFELLTPISPAAKLVHMRTAVEDYEQTQVFGTENSFWGHPVRDFFGPFFDSAKNAMGFKGIPSQVQEKRDLEEYFDILKYVKYTRLKRAAQVASDEDAVSEYENKRRETLFGINPYTYNFSHIFRSLPRRDRDYFNAFIEADLDERQRILEIIPENEQALLLARWEMEDAADIKKAIKEGVLTEEQMERGKQQISEMFESKETEGMPKDRELWAEYLTTRLEGENYPDWYRRVKLLEEELAGKALPGEDWVGWHPAVDLRDIKLKIVENQAKNMYDYDLWPDRAKAVARRPFIAEAAAEIEDTPDYETLRARLADVLSAHDIESSHITLIASQPGDSVVNLDLEHDRSMDMYETMRRYI